MVFDMVLLFITGQGREPQTWTWMAIWRLLDGAALAGSWSRMGAWMSESQDELETEPSESEEELETGQVN